MINIADILAIHDALIARYGGLMVFGIKDYWRQSLPVPFKPLVGQTGQVFAKACNCCLSSPELLLNK